MISKRNKKNLKNIDIFMTLAILLVILFIPETIASTTTDIILLKITQICLFLSFSIPINLLIRKKKNNFYKKKWWNNIFGFTIIFLFFLFFAYFSTKFYSQEFKEDLQNYVTSNYSKEIYNKEKDLNEEKNASVTNKILNENLKIHYLDVGQGDSIFIELPNAQTILIDAAEKKEAEKIEKYIRNLNYNKIDYIIATHPHTDHIGGLSTIIEHFEIGKIYMPLAISTSKTYEDLLNTIANKKLKIQKAQVGTKIIEQKDFIIEFLAPDNTKYDDLNNYSAVVKITWKDNRFLFMGDAEEESENKINQDIKTDVIKVGHHGSDTSSSTKFIKKVNPAYAIISVGKENSYGHPNKEVLNRWKNIGAKIYRTDENGTIIMESDGKEISISFKN